MSAVRRILVTGAGGFVGAHLVPRLRAAFPQAELTLCTAGRHALDITDAQAVRDLVERSRPEACIHLAAVAAVPAARGNPGLAWQVNLHGTLGLAAALLAAAPDCVLLYVSSAEIYGRSFRAGAPLDETAPAAPMNTYAATKAAADLALGAMVSEGLRVVRLRPFNHTGPGQSADFVVPAFARQVARIAAGLQAPVLDVGALDPARDFLDVRDVCDAYVACLEHASGLAAGSIFNIASGTPRRIGDILDRLLALGGVSAEVRTGAALLRPAEIPVACGQARAARAALGWAPMIPWDQTLRDVLADWTERVRAEA
ncbi:MAG: GDP-mannose 4,6-dehydratase [Rhodospirillales bacterium]|nr:GDP-mannose 4,6-dehydratase [Rhodospirillales bacterium]